MDQPSQEPVDITPTQDTPANSSKPKNKGRGSKVVAILMVLIIVVGAGLGGWELAKVQDKTKTDAQIADLQSKLNNVKPAQAQPAATHSIKVDVGKSLTLKYPQDWSVVKTVHASYRAESEDKNYKDETVEDAVFTSPSGDVTVKIGAGYGGLGGACIEAESSTFTSVKSTDLASTQDFKLLTTTTKDNQYASYITTAKNAAMPKVGGTVCSVPFAMFLAPDSNPKGAYTLSVKVPELDKKIDAKTATQSEVTAILTNTEFKQAQQILLSLVQS